MKNRDDSAPAAFASLLVAISFCTIFLTATRCDNKPQNNPPHEAPTSEPAQKTSPRNK